MADELQAGTTQNTGDATAAETQITPEGGTTALTDGAPAGTEQQAAEGQPAAKGAQASEAPEAKPDGEADAQSAPESYEFKAPEGVNLDEAVIGEFSTVAKELGLTQDAAQKMVERLAPKIAERQQAQQAEAFANYRAELVKQTKADAEIGGENLDANLAVAKKARDAFASKELRTLLEQTGLGDHPEMIRFFFKAGKAISEDGFVPSGAQFSKEEKSAADKLYGGQKS